MKKLIIVLFSLLIVVGLTSPVYATNEKKPKATVEVLYSESLETLNDIQFDDGSYLSDYDYTLSFSRFDISSYLSNYSASYLNLGDYFTTVAWITRSMGTTLSLVPKDNVRSSFSTAITAWNALSNVSFGFGGYTTFINNKNKFCNQYVCHFDLAGWKNDWNLDAWRPDVSIVLVYAALCNPE